MEVRLSIWRCVASFTVTSLLLCLIDAKPDVEKRCSTCREIITSFNEGLERTARFNFEGGDTDWEEKKLGSYSTSETRFIEILETLCKRTEYECNVFVEEVEEILEEWWRNSDREQGDFERWLCMEKVSVCCPTNRYGPDCEECLGGTERPCSGNGNCKGAGTRGGTGKCKCNGGYKGDLCDVCKKGFYESHKNETDIECTACDSSCSSTCTGPGPKACAKCKGGYDWDEEEGCQDIDECKRDPETYPCEKEQYCLNSPGSHECKNCDIACTECLGGGNDKCVSCREGYSMEENVCRDIDECESNPCGDAEHMECSNSPGSYFCDCEEGYVSDGTVCVDKSILTDDSAAVPPDQSEQDLDTETLSNDQSPDQDAESGGASVAAQEETSGNPLNSDGGRNGSEDRTDQSKEDSLSPEQEAANVEQLSTSEHSEL